MSLPTGSVPIRAGWLDRSLTVIERVGNALPHPGTLFALMALLVVVASGIAAQFDLVVTHPGTGKEIHPVNLMTVSGLHRMLEGMVTNFRAIMAPVFVPMFMLLGYSPALTQTAYRIGDSSTNIISPMMTYFALIVAFVSRYQPKAGIGTVIATMLPYSVSFLVVWTLLLIVWMLLGLPTGPGAPLFIAGK